MNDVESVNEAMERLQDENAFLLSEIDRLKYDLSQARFALGKCMNVATEHMHYNDAIEWLRWCDIRDGKT